MTCFKHGDYTAKHLQYGKTGFWSNCPQCIAEQDEAEAKKEERPLLWLSKRRQNSTFKTYVCPNPTSEEIVRKLRSYCDNFTKPGKVKDQGTSLCFVGQTGTGKTHLACAIGIELHNQGQTVAYKRHHEIMYSVKETYSGRTDTDEAIIIRNLINVDLLIIDEVGLKKLTETELEITYKLLDGRYDDMKPSILVSNLSEPELADCVGSRIIDRMYENHGTVFVFNWESYRRR